MAEYKDVEPLKRQIADFKRAVKSENSDYLTGYISALSAVEGMIAGQPAADVEPVRHGRWNTGYFHDRVCSCCLHPDNDINDYAHSYCPHCGAKMDGGEGK